VISLAEKEEIGRWVSDWWDFDEKVGFVVSRFAVFIEKSLGRDQEAFSGADVDLVVLYEDAVTPRDILEVLPGDLFYSYNRLRPGIDLGEKVRDEIHIRAMHIGLQVRRRYDGHGCLPFDTLYSRYVMSENGILVSEYPAGYASDLQVRVMEITQGFEKEYKGIADFERKYPKMKQRITML